jgi:hypothetical protein
VGAVLPLGNACHEDNPEDHREGIGRGNQESVVHRLLEDIRGLFGCSVDPARRRGMSWHIRQDLCASTATKGAGLVRLARRGAP